jgi:hypothetical protein
LKWSDVLPHLSASPSDRGRTCAGATARKITTPKEELGFNIGDDYQLANYTQLTAYWKKAGAAGVRPDEAGRDRQDRREPAAVGWR